MKMNRRGTRVAVAHWKWRWFMIFSAFMRLVYFIINFHVNIWKQLYFMRSVSPYCINQVCPTPQKWGFAPPLPRPVKITKTCWVQSWFQWNSEGNYKEGSNFVRLIFASLTNQLIYALFCPAPQILTHPANFNTHCKF